MASLSTISVDTQTFLGIPAPRRIRPLLELGIAARAYLPRTDDPEADWVASIAVPAFARLAQRRGPGAAPAFCALGTGSGLDALAAVEVLGADTVAVTDLFPDVVEQAAANVAANLAQGIRVRLHSGAGDLLAPLAGQGLAFDVIYENLPNLPLAGDARLEHNRTSGAFLPPRAEAVPDLLGDNLLALHYVALVQARPFLKPGGAVLSTLGGRVPLSVIAALAETAGLVPEILTYGWKVQDEADNVIGAYAAWQAQGLGPFHFYLAEDLKAAFTGLDPAEAAIRATGIERTLAPRQLDAQAAWTAHRAGARIGHTVAVLKSEVPR